MSVGVQRVVEDGEHGGDHTEGCKDVDATPQQQVAEHRGDDDGHCSGETLEHGIGVLERGRHKQPGDGVHHAQPSRVGGPASKWFVSIRLCRLTLHVVVAALEVGGQRQEQNTVESQLEVALPDRHRILLVLQHALEIHRREPADGELQGHSRQPVQLLVRGVPVHVRALSLLIGVWLKYRPEDGRRHHQTADNQQQQRAPLGRRVALAQ
mmetsp:Transcript_11323/g.18438  ORF Transcript_11323/g.18438 Transcript_11323/m.18438 type:complete len:210 (-) Transcript_11323:579-1208(-)